MAQFDWKKLVGGIAPVLGTALGGPLIGEAVSMLGQALGLGPSASEEDVAMQLGSAKLSGDQIVAIRTAETDFKIKMEELKIDLQKVNNAADAAYITDTSDARHVFGQNDHVFTLGCFILGGFVLLMAAVLTGCFLMVTGRIVVDPNVIAVATSLIGTVVGYVAANAQQVVSYFYGSSKGSKDNGERIGAALTESLKQTAAATTK